MDEIVPARNCAFMSRRAAKPRAFAALLPRTVVKGALYRLDYMTKFSAPSWNKTDGVTFRLQQWDDFGSVALPTWTKLGRSYHARVGAATSAREGCVCWLGEGLLQRRWKKPVHTTRTTKRTQCWLLWRVHQEFPATLPLEDNWKKRLLVLAVVNVILHM